MSNAALERLANAKTYADNAKPNYGRYRFRIEAHRLKTGGCYGDTAITEMKVVTAEDLPGFPEGCPAERASRVGSNVSYTEGMSKVGKAGDAARSRYQTHLARTFAFDQPLNLGQLGICMDPAKQPGAFLFIECEVTPKWLEPDGKQYQKGTFVKHYRWSTVDPTEEELAEIQQMRAGAKLPDLGAVLEELQAAGQ